MQADPGIMPDAWKTIVPEGPDAIDDWSIVGGKIYVNRLKDVKTETSVYSLDGKPAGHGRLRRHRLRLGRRRPDDRPLWLFSVPVVHHAAHDLSARYGHRQARCLLPAENSLRLQPVRAQAGLLTSRRTAPSVPMFIAGKKGLKQDGTERLLMTGYGGFNLSELRRGTRSGPGGWSRAAGLRCPTCAAAASTARTGTSRACSRRSRTSSTTGSRRPNT